MQDENIPKILSTLQSLRTVIHVAFPVLLTCFVLLSVLLMVIVWDTRQDMQQLEHRHSEEFRALIETVADDNRLKEAQITNLKAFKTSTAERLKKLEGEVNAER